MTNATINTLNAESDNGELCSVEFLYKRQFGYHCAETDTFHIYGADSFEDFEKTMRHYGFCEPDVRFDLKRMWDLHVGETCFLATDNPAIQGDNLWVRLS